ncbi:response regulator [Myxococcota bacterium]|nr:response regulator [Myxococcota bacterium]MBU1380392.1 response regulator [Myxococcota bacterium]MBU1495462.1 response regulator [Myxococcota bacterium]
MIDSNRFIPQKIVSIYSFLVIVIVIILLITGIFQFRISSQSEKWLQTNREITDSWSRIEKLRSNLNRIRVSFALYLNDVPHFTEGTVNEFHPYKADIFKYVRDMKTVIATGNNESLLDRGIFDPHLEKLRNNFYNFFQHSLSGEQAKKTYEDIQESLFIIGSLLDSRASQLRYISRNNITAVRQNQKFNWIVLLCLTAFFLGFIFLGLWFGLRLNNRIRSIHNYLAKLETLKPLEYAENDEIKPLIDLFNTLIVELQSRTDEIETARNFLDNILESSPAAYIAADRTSGVTHCNRRASELFKCIPEEATGKQLRQLHPITAGFEKRFLEVIHENKISSFEHSALQGEETKHFSVSIFPMGMAQVIGAVIRLEDITEQKIREEQLAAANKMELVGNLIGGLAHDFNNVLGAIIGTLSIIDYYQKNNIEISNADWKEYLEIIDNSATRARDMVEGLLTISRKKKITMMPVDLKVALMHVIKICRTSFEKTIEVQVEMPDASATANCDPTQIEQVFLNLAINASHAMTIMRPAGMRHGGKLFISLRKINADKTFCEIHPLASFGEYWVVTVNDTGVGMTPETVSRIWDPFFTTKTDGKGLGLGLAMVFNIIKQHGGFVTVQSETGIGSTFNVFLPVMDMDAEGHITSDGDITTGEGTILLIEDESILSKVAQTMLSECGYHVITASDGDQGIKAWKNNRNEINLILLDLVMPVKNGAEVFKEIRETDPGLPIVLMSGFIQDPRITELLEQGAMGFLKKPFTIDSLSQTIGSILMDKKQ